MHEYIFENIEKIKNKISDAAKRSGRHLGDITIVAVTKNREPELIAKVVEAGITTIGENRVQEAKSKVPLLPDTVEWHMVGHLQTNKVKDAIKIFELIHSVDSVRLAVEIDRRCSTIGKVMPVFIQVNISDEETKFGLNEGELIDVIKQISNLSNISIQGLMTMPPFVDDPEEVRPIFRRLRELKDKINAENILQLEHLSMGMTQDYEVAVEEGATMVRIGSAIFQH